MGENGCDEKKWNVALLPLSLSLSLFVSLTFVLMCFLMGQDGEKMLFSAPRYVSPVHPARIYLCEFHYQTHETYRIRNCQRSVKGTQEYRIIARSEAFIMVWTFLDID